MTSDDDTIRALLLAIDRCRDNSYSVESRAHLERLADAIAQQLADASASG